MEEWWEEVELKLRSIEHVDLLADLDFTPWLGKDVLRYLQGLDDYGEMTKEQLGELLLEKYKTVDGKVEEEWWGKLVGWKWNLGWNFTQNLVEFERIVRRVKRAGDKGA